MPYGYVASFGIGTSLTNDFRSISSGGKEKSKALNMVIKLASVDNNNCVKISDELSKVRPVIVVNLTYTDTLYVAEHWRTRNCKVCQRGVRNRRIV